MNSTATISNDSDGLSEQRLMEESDPMTDEQRSEVQRWSYCCRLISKEAEHAVSNLHFAHVLRSQFTNGNRWPLLCHLRSIELHHKKTGLVCQFHVWMRKLDQALAHDGIFVGSYTRRYLVHPEMGEIPQIECEVVDLGLV